MGRSATHPSAVLSARSGERSFDEILWRAAPAGDDVQSVRELVTSTGVFSGEEVAIAAELVTETLERGSAAGYEFVFAERVAETRRLVGYSCFGPIPATAESFDIYWIAVHADERRCGLGAALLARSEAQIAAAGGRCVWIDTSSRDDYAPAHRLYRAAGYREASRLEGFYAPGDAKLIFAKTLAISRAPDRADGDR